jgi:chromosome partitioning protein
MTAETRQFRELFDAPSVTGMGALSQSQFAGFVEYVFQRAGYHTTKPLLKLATGVDLTLYHAGDYRRLQGAIALQFAQADNPVPAQIVRKLKSSGAVRKQGGSAYVVTNGNFDPEAYEQAGPNQHTFLLDGNQFCRYVQYVRGSRYHEATGITVLIPPDMFAGQPLARSAGDRYTKVLAVANNKGGVGKTTTARYFAQALAEKGKRILVVDLDPQTNLTEAFLNEAPDTESMVADPPHLGHYFAGQCALARTARPTSTPNIALIPAHHDLSLLDTGGAGQPTVESRFAFDLLRAFAAPTQDGSAFDWIVLDTPPAISLFTRAALCAADYVIAPARSRPTSLAGIGNMMRTMDTMNALRGAPAQLIGCLITHWEDDLSSRETYTRLEEQFENRRSRILSHYVPALAAIDRTHGPGHQHVIEAYQGVIEEVLEHVERDQYRNHDTPGTGRAGDAGALGRA